MSESKKKVNVKELIILTAVLPVIVIAVCSVVIYFTAISAVPENALMLKDETPADTVKIPENKEAAAELVKKLLYESADSGILRIDSSTDTEIKDISGENESLIKILEFVKKSYIDKMSSLYEEKDVNYGGDALFIKDIMPACAAEDFSAEEDGGLLKISLIYPSLEGTDFEAADTEMAKQAVDENIEAFTVSDAEISRTRAEVRAVIDKKDGRLESIAVLRDYAVALTLGFTDELSCVGQNRLSFVSTVISRFELSEAGIKLLKDKITLGRNDYETLEAEINIDEASDDYSLSFTSSDPSVARVKENGMVEAKKESAVPVTITAELKYLGKTFTSRTEVWVVKEVKSLKINEKSLTLGKGEEFVLEAGVKPDDATIKGFSWASEDPAVASVDENGKVTASGTGTTKIYALSDDGEHGIACTVTVQ